MQSLESLREIKKKLRNAFEMCPKLQEKYNNFEEFLENSVENHDSGTKKKITFKARLSVNYALP
jgi:hypothetical protein